MGKNKKAKKQTSFMKNVLMLMAAQITIKILGFLYRLVIINIEGFGDTGNGYYATGYQIYSLLLTLSSVGIPTVISKLVAERTAIGDHRGAHRIFKTALKTFTTIGVVMSLGLFFGADFIAKNIINVEGVKYTLSPKPAWPPTTNFPGMKTVLSFVPSVIWFFLSLFASAPIATELYAHMKRVKRIEENPDAADELRIDKSNIIFLGPTGKQIF